MLWRRCVPAFQDSLKPRTGHLTRVAVPILVRTSSQVFGRHAPRTDTVAGAYLAEFDNKDEINDVIKKVEEFQQRAGRRPRLLVAKVGVRHLVERRIDGHITASFVDNIVVSPVFI